MLLCLGPCSQKQYNNSNETPCVLNTFNVAPEEFIIDLYNRKMDSILKTKQVS